MENRRLNELAVFVYKVTQRALSEACQNNRDRPTKNNYIHLKYNYIYTKNALPSEP